MDDLAVRMAAEIRAQELLALARRAIDGEKHWRRDLQVLVTEIDAGIVPEPVVEPRRLTLEPQEVDRARRHRAIK